METPYNLIKEILLSLMGEESKILKLNVDETDFVIRQEIISPVWLKLDKLKTLSMNVRNIELWRRNVTRVDTIKRAFVVSLCESYAEYEELIDIMRMNHINRTSEMSLSDVSILLNTWHNRINFINSLASKSNELSGIQLIDKTFNEWCTQCAADWSFTVLEKIMMKTSIAFHDIALKWLLQGESTQDDKSSFKLPAFLMGCHHLVFKINEIGVNIRSLKKFRGKSTFESSKAEELFKGVDKSKIWYSLYERGHLYNIINQLSVYISQDLMNELMEKQKLLDHLQFVHDHFFMLRGDFTDALHDAIRLEFWCFSLNEGRVNVDSESTGVKDRTRAEFENVPAPKRTGVSYVAEACLNYALNCVDQKDVHNDLRRNICAQVTKKSSTSPYQHGLAYSHKLVDNLRLSYKPPMAIEYVFGKSSFLEYSDLFKLICPARLLLADTNVLSMQIIQLAKMDFSLRNEEQKTYWKMLNNFIFQVQHLLRIVVLNLFEKVFSEESNRLMDKLKNATDVDSLRTFHTKFLERIKEHVAFLRDVEPETSFKHRIRKVLQTIEMLIVIEAEQPKQAKYIVEVCQTLKALNQEFPKKLTTN